MKTFKLTGEQAFGFCREIGVSAALPRQRTKLENLAAQAHFLGSSLGPLIIEISSSKNLRLTIDSVKKDVKAGTAQAILVYGLDQLHMLKILSEAIATELNELNVDIVLFLTNHPAAPESSIDDSLKAFVSDDSFPTIKESALLTRHHLEYLEKFCESVMPAECLRTLDEVRPELRVFLRASANERAALRRDFISLHPVFICGFGVALNQQPLDSREGYAKWVGGLNLHRAHGVNDIFGCCIESGIVVNTARRAQALAENLVQNYEKSLS